MTELRVVGAHISSLLPRLARLRVASALTLIPAVGCGGADSADEPVVEEQDTSGSERHPSSEDDGVAVEGLMGTISTMAVQRGIEPRMGAFQQCLLNRYASVEVLGGRIEMGFRIHTDGRVRWVYARQSSLGDRETERCIVDAASRIRFSRPAGGEAEFTFPLELDLPADVRPPLNWTEAEIAEQLEAQRSSLDCGGGRYVVTAYIKRGGEILAVGASTEDPEAAANIDCVCDAVRGWEMPDPGSYPAKVSFTL